MKYALIFICIISACSPKTPQENSTSDGDTLLADTLSFIEEAQQDETFLVSESAPYGEDSTKSIFESCLQEVATGLEAKSVYRLSASFSGYESSSDATYFFDSTFNLLYSETSWSMEGTSGTYTNYFENDLLAAARELNSYNAFDEDVIICPHDGIFGYRSSTGEFEAANAFLTEEDFKSKQAEAVNEFYRIKDRISEYQSEAVKEQRITKIRIENTVNYGEDHTETETFEIDDPLFEALFE